MGPLPSGPGDAGPWRHHTPADFRLVTAVNVEIRFSTSFFFPHFGQAATPRSCAAMLIGAANALRHFRQ